MPRTRNKAKLETARARMYHDLIFENAERVFAEEGFAESSMQDLAAESGVSLKTVYATFPGKDDIYREILTVRGAGLLEVMQSGAEAEGTALERLGIGLRAIIDYLAEHEAFFRILIQEGQAWGLNPRGESGRESWEAGLAAVRSILEDGMASGEFLAGDLDLLTPTVNAVLQVQLAGLLDRSAEPDPEAMTDAILVTLERMLCGGDRSARPAAA